MWSTAPLVWRAAPFAHAVIDDFVSPAGLERLFAVLDEEPVERYVGDLFAFDATAPEPVTAELCAVRDSFAAALCPLLGASVTRADMRAYAYRIGDYLLPHTDHRGGLARAFAYAYYLPSPEPPVGGELALYACEIGADGELEHIASGAVIEPRANRLCIFEVSDVSLHEVREVLGGVRLSLAGWFYP